MVAKIKAIKPTRKFLLDINEIEGAVEGTLDEGADEALELFEKTVKTWKKTKVKFWKRKTKLGRAIGTDSDIYAYVDKGTKPHVIRARRAPALRFRVGGFKPKTRPNVIGSFAGAPANGAWVTRDEVMHPGNKARNFSKKIQEKMRKRNYTIWRRRSKNLFAPRGSK